MQEEWRIYGKKADFEGLSKRLGIDPVTARIIRNRELTEEEEIQQYLYGSLKDCHSPFLMKNMEEAVEILGKKIRAGKAIRVIGDYDVDGICATYILVKAIKRLGGNVDYDIPDRIQDGYGINVKIIDLAAADGVDTLLTCDNGIAAGSQIAHAKELGMTVLVTDHHEVPFEETETGEKREILPPADVVVNPRQASCTYPFKLLCGAAIAYKLAWALYETWEIPKSELSPFVEVAALATVGDVMLLQGENRILVKEGLERMADSKIQGLKALIEANGLNASALGCYHLGFVLGPCLNAGGRLDTAKKSLALLLSERKTETPALAWELKALNDRRKDMTAKSVEAAIHNIEETGIKEDDVYVVYLPECHESLAGIVAGRIREKYQHPVFVITKAASGLKGSGRSIPSYSMYEHLVRCQEYLTVFGGHPMAAGLSLPEENLEAFRAALNRDSGLTEADFVKRLWIDVPMPFSYVTEKLVSEFRLLEPFGNGNEKPLFAQKGLMVRQKNLVGKNKNVLKFLLSDETGLNIEAIQFQDAANMEQAVEVGDWISVAYYPNINEYMGRRTLQMVIQSSRQERKPITGRKSVFQLPMESGNTIIGREAEKTAETEGK
ncbi:MAG: single-stranded-DNA-specific exonuclease RecJ [Lachnospiraceae bacterium]|nr:single-stranded-DNA-specific exonuclease RecJ [Lachnospiraceae bacterium]